jgi:hypothetical protein
MDDQIEKLEEFAADAKERLVRLETRTEAMAANMATKADIARLDERIDGLARITAAEFARIDTRFGAVDARIDAAVARLEATLLKWFIGTTVTVVGLLVAAMQLFR